jgi:hypothetical protein
MTFRERDLNLEEFCIETFYYTIISSCRGNNLIREGSIPKRITDDEEFFNEIL